MRDYRSYLRAVGRKPLKGKLRTEKKPGDTELCWHPDKGFIAHVHEGETAKVVPIKRRAA